MSCFELHIKLRVNDTGPVLKHQCDVKAKKDLSYILFPNGKLYVNVIILLEVLYVMMLI